jgi:raffinose/stachyose/melibiose transport system substrate-binding protein
MFLKNKRPRALLAGAALLALSSLALGGCSAAAPASGGSATKGKVTWWSWTPAPDLAAREIAAFNKQYPNIKVTFKNIPSGTYPAVLRPALASNNGPDVFSLYNSGASDAEAFSSYALDLTPYISKLLGSDWKSKIQARGAADYTVKGKLVAAPFAKVGAGMLWINKAIFDKYKVTPPKTMAEWVKDCQIFRANGLGCLQEGVGGGIDLDTLHSIADSVEPGVYADALSGKKKWTDPALVEAWTIFRQIATNGILDQGSVGMQQYPDVNNNFLSGKVPMVDMGTWYAQYATVPNLTAALAGAGVSASTSKVTIFPISFPDVAGKGNPSSIYADPDAANAVNAKSKVRSAAVTFALWLGNTAAGQNVVVDNLDSGANLKGVLPSWGSIDLVNPKVQIPVLKQVSKELEDTSEIRAAGFTAVVQQAVQNADAAVVSGQMTPAQAAASVQAAADSGK